ncbi:chloramphenicol phosphotransferase CPT [Isoptericola sp. NEAU-Y5]|uniref:Chloramphenicol phosphotransferase CPT n=1 Tax=Isoptericola luteus TaxID=2879484 RepID=A0ABS7ZD83_9MICO|nr:chloramphenicol phosphotransferase CPT [Isoptericola sp. NEAU-Y5]MCA5892417.1 chloramphenicol phosphotransferase CPT [Isoptericola sp. NEAU-Y5]
MTSGLTSTDLIVLNGGSSSGKTTIARRLQDLLPRPWLAFSIDDFVDAMPASLQDGEEGLDVGADGGVSVGPVFTALEAAWRAGVAATARAGAPVVVDDVFLGGVRSQDRWTAVLDGLDVLWVGIRCDPAVAAAREAARGDRAAGMAALQADVVHRGVRYDVEVDSGTADAGECARQIAAHVR